MFQEREVLTVCVKGTNKKLGGFTDWIKQLDQKFPAQNRKVASILDNCLAHPHVSGLTVLDLIFLLPNRTSVTQPIDEGVMRSLKAK